MYNSLQYLRAISAIAVVYFHLYQTTGQQGVAIFFVISGFIMMDLIDKKHRKAFDFFKARFFRIAPLYYLLTIITLFLGIAYEPTLLRLIQSFSFTALGSILPVGYTLTYEFVFYTLVSVSISIWGGYLNIKLIIFIVFTLIVGDLILNNILISRGYEYGNYFIIFIFGMLVFYLQKNYKQNLKRLSTTFIISFIIMSTIYLFFGHYIFNFHHNSVNQYALNNTIPSFFIVLGFLILESKNKIFNSNLFLLLGNASYSIYLTHYIVIHATDKFITTEYSNFVMLLLCIIIGILTYRYIELPMLNYTHKKFLEVK